jgi:hypothetical protein
MIALIVVLSILFVLWFIFIGLLLGWFGEKVENWIDNHGL